MASDKTRLAAAALAFALAGAACSREKPPPVAEESRADNVLLITIDTLRADRVGAYGYGRAVTPALDSLARGGVRFDRAYAAAPITQTSHATLLTGRYPQGHGARHNGIRIDDTVPTVAERFQSGGFATAAFVSAFPLDRRFGLARGFQTYGDTLPGDANGRPLNEKKGSAVVDEAIAWVGRAGSQRFFLWVHLFEPHAPYGEPADPSFAGLSASDRYDREIAEADRQVARLLAALGERRKRTLIVATSDHGEAFGEHGEIGHSMFVYDTTLRVPLLIEGPGVAPGRAVDTWNVGLVDIAATVVTRAGLAGMDTDGHDLSAPHLNPRRPGDPVAALIEYPYYAETFAPLLDFGWSPLRTMRDGRWKYIEAPRPELYEIQRDAAERDNRVASEIKAVELLTADLKAVGGKADHTAQSVDPGGRLAALGYIGASPSARGRTAARRADPKDKIEVAAAIAHITSGEARGPALERALRAVLAEDPANPQMNLRLGYVLAESGRCRDARVRFSAAIAGRVPTADAHLGLASCQAAAREFDAALGTLREAARLEPGNPLVTANLGLVMSDAGKPAEAAEVLRRVLIEAPDLHQARFGLAVALARAGRRTEAAAEARELLRRLPSSAPQRPEVLRLLSAVSSQ
ncbi:MAG: sulfatase-like hydrolase/transferase [Acidobacteriota bacterium]|nr:sulfatase-like hydrolase/transferase [Acidobacteriota bacterium]